MNKEEILNKYTDLIDKGYCSDCNELNCIDNFPHAKIAHAIRELQQENKILKENSYHNDKVVDKVNWENQLLKKENQDLKKQLENKYEKVGTLTSELLYEENTKLINQQKEFINYLEKRYKDITSVIGSYGSNTDMLYGKKDILEEIFQEFKSIIGDDK